MKILSLLLPILASTAQAHDTLVTCQIQNFSVCAACHERVRASCEDNTYIGNIELKTKPQKIHWQISNIQNGTEKNVITENSKLTLKDLKDAKSLQALARKNKIKVEDAEIIQVTGIQISAFTKMYKATKGTEVAYQNLKPENQKRAIASIHQDAPPVGGGVKRAQNLKVQK